MLHDGRHLATGEATGREGLARHYQEVRAVTEELCRPLVIEDYVVQSMPDASPAKWHLAHTTWFFETFVLAASVPGYRPFHPAYNYLFNSYYNAAGERWQRSGRGTLSRPTVAEVYAYRRAIDGRVLEWLAGANEEQEHSLGPVLELGLHHEQQHQELLLTDIKHAFASNPLRPAYRASGPRSDGRVPPLTWQAFPAGVRWLGHDGRRFAYDNETPRHRTFVEAFELASRLTTSGEYLAFMEEGGYQRPEWWLSDGWAARCTQGWQAPLYWEQRGAGWWLMTMQGMREVMLEEPVCHVSYYEADAFARWSKARLPTEAEWETAAEACPVDGNFLEVGNLHPVPLDSTPLIGQMFGDVWEWTASPYVAYPGYRPPEGALGEYNGKFMCNQLVLRGGSCATPASHIRASYRNFFPPEARWQFSGIRLARGPNGKSGC
jgi:ergothioneine biosynthesis protein EgtB